MVAEEQPSTDSQKSVPLKFEEPRIDSDNPWRDDLLSRQDIATTLTNLVSNQEQPLTISLHGQWGTGKTFLLTRWQKQLENSGYKAIYFNAWEDDFCDDPLLAIIGQLSHYFNKSTLGKIAKKVAEIAIPLIRENVFGVLKAATGVTLKANEQSDGEKSRLDTYLEQRSAKDELKGCLTQLAEEVMATTEHPLVFIIDELDRCRPTFAIELLERVKHIFDVPNLAFVFGINREELCNSIRSVYGPIDADIYLRRFFDMPLNLPTANSEAFTRHMMRKYELTVLKQKDHFPRQRDDIDEIFESIPTLWSGLALSLRDIDYCVRLIGLIGMTWANRPTMFPWMLGILIALKLKNPELYEEFLEGNCRGSKVMDYFDRVVPVHDQNSLVSEILTRAEAHLYLSDKRYGTTKNGQALVLHQLNLLKGDSQTTHPDYISQRTRKASRTKITRLIQLMERYESDLQFTLGWTFPATAVRFAASLIELNQEIVRR